MTIKKRLILSNIGMIIIPIVAFLAIEIMLGYIFYLWVGGAIRDNLELFLSLRIIGMLLVIIVTNGMLTYFVSQSIIRPIQELMNAAKEISNGNLDYKMEVNNKKDELDQLTADFEAMRLKLKKAQELQNIYEENQKELIASISHDLKTPITSIRGYVKGIQDGVANTPDKLDRYMKTIDQKAQGMNQLIEELFLYSKLDLQSVPFDFEELDLNAYLKDYIEEINFDLEKEGVAVTYNKNEGDVYTVYADRDKIKRVLDNIIQNSLRYMNKEIKQLKISLVEEDVQVLVEIMDNGIGIKEDLLPFIFDRFYRIDSSRSLETGGSGLGLAIVKKIVEEHRGTIWAQSRLGEGTSVIFTLPKPTKEDNYE
ncbi:MULTISPECIES: sensor histidine kinase [Bacillaceae]|uniref:histidine kinase n=1 Tax=Evansella alkalicola TaxID=745819 RepID=A0ABS6JXX2_9BACI|nr:MULTISPECIES: HAMP domain-containing sensor histidine kinase [Bacillaceae]MBU9723446.1 HAMP domain-containing histidine kinase [Bacillus alkalicola]